MALSTLQSLAQNLSNGVRANFPSTPAPTSTPIKPSQAMPGTGKANTNAATTNSILFGNKATNVTPSFGTGSPSANAARTATTLTSPQWQKDLSNYLSGVQKGPTASSIPPTGGSVQTPLKQAPVANVGPSTAQPSQAGTVQGDTWTSPTGAVINTKTGHVISGPTGSSTSVSYTPPPQIAPSTTPPQTQPQGEIGQTGQTTTPRDMTYGGLIQQLLQKGEGTSAKIADLQNQLALQLGQTRNRAIPLEFQTGRAQTLQNMAEARKTALEGELANVSNVLGRAITATAPTMQFGQLTDPRTGLPISSDTYGGNPQLQSAVQQAVQLVQNGADPNSSAVQNLLGTFGMPGQAAFTNAMQQVSRGTYNPTAQSAISQSNVQTGIGAVQTAAQLGVAMDRYHNIANQAVNFLKTAGINATNSPNFNKPINDWLQGNLTPADKIVADAMFADLKNAGASIIGTSSNLTPTEITAMTASFDPRNLSPKDLQVYIDNISKLGQTNKAAFEKQGAGALGAGTTAYVGTPAVGGQTLQTGQTVSVPEATAASLVGMGTGVLSGIANFFGSIFK